MNYLQFLRVQARLTQRELAKRVRIQPAIISKLERGWFARCPGGLEDKLQKVFGIEWTFERLMESVPNIANDDMKAS